MVDQKDHSVFFMYPFPLLFVAQRITVQDRFLKNFRPVLKGVFNFFYTDSEGKNSFYGALFRQAGQFRA